MRADFLVTPAKAENQGIVCRKIHTQTQAGIDQCSSFDLSGIPLLNLVAQRPGISCLQINKWRYASFEEIVTHISEDRHHLFIEFLYPKASAGKKAVPELVAVDERKAHRVLRSSHESHLGKRRITILFRIGALFCRNRFVQHQAFYICLGYHQHIASDNFDAGIFSHHVLKHFAPEDTSVSQVNGILPVVLCQCEFPCHDQQKHQAKRE